MLQGLLKLTNVKESKQISKMEKITAKLSLLQLTLALWYFIDNLGHNQIYRVIAKHPDQLTHLRYLSQYKAHYGIFCCEKHEDSMQDYY